MAKIEIRQLSKSFRNRDGSQLPVLSDLTLDVTDSEFVCLLGPSGCGKSTTLDVLANLTDADTGEVLIDGDRDHSLLPGYVFQRPRLLSWRTVAQNLRFALTAQRVPRAEHRSRIDEHLAMVGLSDFADAYPLTLSGGMQQRTAIARALAIDPEVLLMDEPFSSLDELTARRLRTELVSIWERAAKTIVFVTHNALEAAYLADRIYVVSDRPASLVATFEVTIPRPRRPDDPELLAIQQRVVSVLEGSLWGADQHADHVTEGAGTRLASQDTAGNRSGGGSRG